LWAPQSDQALPGCCPLDPLPSVSCAGGPRRVRIDGRRLGGGDAGHRPRRVRDRHQCGCSRLRSRGLRAGPRQLPGRRRALHRRRRRRGRWYRDTSRVSGNWAWLAMVGALALALDVATGRDGRGTAVTMAFGHAPALAAPPGLELLCVLALETVADGSCVDLVHEGVLRRVAAEVADDAALTSWLRAAVPPAKPGTATWSALREGGARLVVHDRTVPRSPGGTGERLNLTWCGHRLSRRGTNRARARSEAGAGRTPASGHSRGRGYTRGTCSGRAQFSRRANARFAGTRAASRPARWSQRVDLASAGRRGLDRARRVPASTSSNSRSVFPSRRSRPRRHACSRSTAARDPCASAAGPRMTGACIRATAGH
jgi:hypothetical protein